MKNLIAISLLNIESGAYLHAVRAITRYGPVHNGIDFRTLYPPPPPALPPLPSMLKQDDYWCDQQIAPAKSFPFLPVLSEIESTKYLGDLSPDISLDSGFWWTEPYPRSTYTSIPFPLVCTPSLSRN